MLCQMNVNKGSTLSEIYVILNEMMYLLYSISNIK